MKFHFSYKLIVGSLIVIALVMAGGFLTISYIYRIQDANNLIIKENVKSVRAANELEIALYHMRIISLNYVIDKDTAWIRQLRQRENDFLYALDKAQLSANTPEEENIIRQISALFSNFEQNLNTGLALQRQGSVTRANRLLLHGSRDLINTIEQKSKEFIQSNESQQAFYEESIRKNNDFISSAMYALGFGGMVLGLVLGWMVARIILNPIYKLVLKVRGAAGSEMVEHIKMSPGKELEEIDLHINRMISRINQAHEDLEKNRALLERSSKLAAIGRLAPAIAHEIRNPLAAIKMLIYSMLNEPDISSEKQEDLKIMTHEIERMEGFLQNFLKYARPSRPQMKEVEIVRVVRETLHLMLPRIRQHGVEVSELYQDEKIMLRADPDQLKQIFMNLLLNAVEAMERGGRLDISTSLEETGDEEAGKKYLKVNISDSGKGIPDDIIDSLFDPFVKNKEGGVGLGLSISQRIAELHHGWIKAANNPGHGATFTLYLPLEEQSQL
jgi:signal transduction histidine kinase